MYGFYQRKISKEDYDEIKAGKKSVYDLFSAADVMGYGLVAYPPIEVDGEYIIQYHMSDSCD